MKNILNRHTLMIIGQVAVTSAAAYYSAMFNTQHDVLPAIIAWPLAAGFEIIYLTGFAMGGVGKWSSGLTWTAFITSFVYGMLYILGLYEVIPEHPEPIAASGLALAHILPIAALSLCAAKVYMDSQKRSVELKRAEEDAEVARKQRESDRQEALQHERDLVQLDLERQYKEAKLKAEVKAMLRPQKVFADAQGVAVAERASTALRTPTNSVHEHSREQIREHIVRTLREHPTTNKAALAIELGIGRTYLYELINEAKKAGELP